MDPSNNKKMAVIILRIKKKNYLSLSITLISFLWNLAHMWHCYFVVGFKLGLHMSSTVLSIFFLPAYQFRGGGNFGATLPRSSLFSLGALLGELRTDWHVAHNSALSRGG